MKKPPSKKNLRSSPGVRIELEEDAEDLFLKSLDHVDPSRVPHTGAPEPLGNHKKSPGKVRLDKTIDLHGLKLAEAKDTVRFAFAKYFLEDVGEINVTIITGKGRHSPEGKGTLVHEVHRFVSEEFRDKIIRIESSPGDTLIEGQPIRGHFCVLLRGKKS